MIVGIPVGTDTIRIQLADKAIKSHAKSINLIVHNQVTGDQAKFVMLKFCANTKIDYLCRNVDSNLIQDSLDDFVSQIDDGLSHIIDEKLDDAAKTLRGLSIKLAGLGLRRHAGVQSFKDYNSRTILVSGFARHHLPELADALEAIGALPLTPNPENSDLSVAAINIIHLKEVCTQVIDGNEQDAKRKSIQDDTFVTALRNLLCMPVCNSDLSCTNTDIHAARNQPAHVARASCALFFASQRRV